jgi:CRISPR-associated endonuclease/helicase Cas3
MAIDPSLVRIDATFPIQGPPIPCSHGYALFSALCRVLGDLHKASWLAVHPIRGTPRADGLLELTPAAHLRLRLRPAELPRVLPLSGAALSLNGVPLQLGAARLCTLSPAPALESALVVFTGAVDEETFRQALRRRLEILRVRGPVQLTRRRILRVSGRRIAGYGVALHDLSEEASLLVQYEGIGGRQRLGCGSFTPTARTAAAGDTQVA